ncbi:MAG: DUF1634 domain-containing protein [Phycisphaerales bacterium]
METKTVSSSASLRLRGEKSSRPEAGADLHRAETIISRLLRLGVLTSLLVIVLGMTLTFLHHPDYLTSKNQLTQLLHNSHPTDSLSGVRQSLAYSQGRGIVVLGLLLLICTPVLRVAASVLIFARQRNRAFVIITLLVLLTLVVSFLLGKVE